MATLLSRIPRHIKFQRRASPGIDTSRHTCSVPHARLETPFGGLVGILPCACDDARVMIGRSPGASIRLSDMFVQLEHARVWWDSQSDTHRIEDLSGVFGTFIDGDRIVAPRSLASGNAISLGKTVLMYHRDPSRATTTVLSPGHMDTT